MLFIIQSIVLGKILLKVCYNLPSIPFSKINHFTAFLSTIITFRLFSSCKMFDEVRIFDSDFAEGIELCNNLFMSSKLETYFLDSVLLNVYRKSQTYETSRHN